jgi:glyoxylase-like metal-dependent hydrolase (beta-lactamase superfamily II)
VVGALPGGDDHQDESFAPDVELEHDMLLDADGSCLRALHTPGHVSNHYCFLLEEEGMLFAGDHIMNGSTVVIIPPGGDMRAYIASLRLLLDYPLQRIAPGHGEVIDDSEAEIRGLVEHRLAREPRSSRASRSSGPAPRTRWCKVVYDDVDPALHPWAKMSMAAHLIKLEGEGRARALGDGAWAPPAADRVAT